MSDRMKIEILADGTLKTTTDPISPANHQSAEAFVKTLAELTGDPGTTQPRHDHARVHAHVHSQEG